MTAPVMLEDLKNHCRVDTDAENATMAAYLDAATESVQQYLNAAAPLDETAPAPVKSAILLLAASLHENREDTSDRQVYRNDTYYRLLAPYRVMSL